MNNTRDFVIEDGALKDYIGKDETVVIPDGVTIIKNFAFYKNTIVTRVTIPDSVIRICPQAFDGCTRLREIRIPKSVEAIYWDSFRLCPVVESIHVEEGNPRYYSSHNCLITQDGKLVRGCKNSTIPTDGSVTYIGEEAFSGVEGLEKVFVPDGVAYLDTGVFFDCTELKEVRLPEGITSIRSGVFSNCKKLNKVNIPTTVTWIDKDAFYACESLDQIVLPTALDTIGRNAFHGCAALTAITIPDGVKTIEECAFNWCKNAGSLSIGAGVTQIGENAFSFCSSLRKVTVSADNPTYFSVNNCVVRTTDKTLVVGCNGGELTADSGIAQIGSHAFVGCEGMECIAVPSTIQHIEKDAFFCCKDLREFILDGDGLTYSGSVYEALFESTRASHDTKKAALYSIVKYAPMHVIQDVGIFGKLKTARKDLVQYAIKRKDVATVEKLFSLFPNINRIELEGYFRLPDITPDIEAFLQSYADTYCAKKPAQKATGPSVAELKALFSFKDIEGGVLAMGYKGTESGITIPATVGKKRVLGISQSSNSAAGWDAPHITISDGIEFIEDGAFSYCRNLQSVSLPPSIREIKTNAFAECSQLTSVALPSGSVVRWGAFRACENLSEVKIPDDVQLETAAFWKCKSLADKDGFAVIRTILCDYSGNDEEPMISDDVTAIGDRAFWNNENIVKIILPNHIESIGNSAFYRCQKLTDVRLSANTKTIGEGAFEGCQALESVIIPNGVKEIGDRAFADCDNLREVHLPVSVTSIGKDAFHSFGEPLLHITIYAPIGSFAEKYAKKNKMSFVAE